MEDQEQEGAAMEWHCQWVQPDDLEAGHLNQIEAIYEASFAPFLKEPFPMLIESVMRGCTALYLASSDRRVGGFALATPLGIAKVNYMPYLAVDTALRGGGIGGALLRCVLEDAYRRTGKTELLWEVERPDPCAGPHDPDRRRIDFYRRYGAVLLERVTDFQMPSLAGPGTVPGALMWASVVDRDPLTPDEVAAYVVTLFSLAYGRDRDDPLVAAVLRSIEKES
jgi:GNAT superfamily N-acetyltransferase